MEALAVGRAHGEALATYTPLASLAEVARQRGDLVLAATRFTDALAVSRAAGHQRHVALMLRRLGELALTRGEDQRAAALLRESAELIYTKGKLWGLINVLELLAAAYAGLGHEERATRLLGGAERLREDYDRPYVAAEQPDVDALVAPARAALSAGVWAPAFAAGHALTLEEIYAETQRDTPEPATGETGAVIAELSRSAVAQDALIAERRPRESQLDRVSSREMTRRELEVLRLLTEGQSDAQIARRLVISVRTVNNHVAAIYGKLGVSSRAAATRVALDRHML
jgi:DNA-binding NarL/FixJ family response regulator